MPRSRPRRPDMRPDIAAEAARETTTHSRSWPAEQTRAIGSRAQLEDNAIAAPMSTTALAAGK